MWLCGKKYKKGHSRICWPLGMYGYNIWLIEGLQKQYGPEGVAEQGLELFLTVISKMFDLFQTAYEGQVVGVIYFNESPSETETMLNLLYTSRPPSRWLEETEGQSNSTAYAEVLLVRRTLAWITGIILLIGTLLGVYFLLNMPLTKDTLLYSNVKLDWESIGAFIVFNVQRRQKVTFGSWICYKPFYPPLFSICFLDALFC